MKKPVKKTKKPTISKKVQKKKPVKKPVKAVKKAVVKKEKKVKILKKDVKPKKEEKFDVHLHYLVPKHIKMSEKEKKEMLEKYKISLNDLPQIFMDDPAIAHLELTTDDVIKIERSSQTTKTSYFYRRVIK